LLVPELVRRRPSAQGTAGEGRLVPTGRELLQMLWVNAAITLSLVLFRSADMAQAGAIFARMVTAPWQAGDHGWWLGPAALAAFPVLVEWGMRRHPHGLAIGRWPVALRWTIYLALILAFVVHGNVESREFVYFQF
ncbi:MAG: hypothetical protein KC549_19285, partial [Myxococcales bacterium]|nr:hypothetical protein [Myxococcales bacterium]